MRQYLLLISLLFLSINSLNAKEEEKKSEAMLNFLLGELSIMREDFKSAGQYFDQLLEENESTFFLERRIGIDMADDNIKASLPYLLSLIEKDPDSISAWNTLALSYLENDQLDDAIQAFRKVLTISDKMGHNSYPFIIQSLQDKEGNEKLIKVLEGIVALNDNDFRPMIVTVGVLIDEKEFTKAKALLKKAKKLDPENSLVYEFLALISLEEGDLKSSLKILTEAYKEFKTPELGLQYAKGLKQDLRYDEALELLRTLYQENPDMALIQKELVNVEYALGHYDEVKSILEKQVGNHYLFSQMASSLFEISQKNETQHDLMQILPRADYYEYIYDYLIQEANIALIDNEYAKFLGLFDELRYSYPHMQDQLYVRQIVMLEGQEEYDKMGGLVELAAPVIKVDFLVTYMRGMHKFYQGDYAEMERIFTEWLDEHPKDDIVLNAYGYSILEYDPSRTEEALELILKANEITPKEDFIEDSIGWAYLKLGQLDLAEEYITKAFNKSKDPEMIAHYLILHDHLGSIDKVKGVYEMFKRLYPKNRHLKELQEEYNWAK